MNLFCVILTLNDWFWMLSKGCVIGMESKQRPVSNVESKLPNILRMKNDFHPIMSSVLHMHIHTERERDFGILKTDKILKFPDSL